MKNRLFRLPEGASSQARNAFRVSLIGFVASAIAASFYLYLALRFGNWQLYAWSADIWILALAALIGLIMTRRGHASRGVWLLMVAIQITFVAAICLISGIGLLLVVSMAILVAVIAGQTLPAKPARQAVILVVGFALVAILVDQILPPYRLAAPEPINVFLPGILGVVILLFGYTTTRQFRDYSLNTKLLVGFLAVTLIPLVVVFYLNNQATTQNLTQSENTALRNAAVAGANQVDNFISGGLVDISTASQLHIFQEYLALPAADRAGSESETQLYKDLHALAIRDRTYITSVGLVDVTGRDLADTYTADISLDKSNRTWFKEPMSTGQPYASPAEISQATGELSIYFTAPVRGPNNNILGILRIRYKATILQNIVTIGINSMNMNSIDAMLLDENHIRLADSDSPDSVLKSLTPLPAAKFTQLQSELRLPSNKSAQALSTNFAALENSLGNLNKQSFFEANIEEDNPSVISEVTVISLHSQPWIFTVGQNRDIFLAPVAAQTRQNIFTGLIIALLVALVAIFIAQTISRPVTELQGVAQQIAAGNINVQAPVNSKDEVGQLASTFNNMTSQLRQTLEDVRRRALAVQTSAAVSRRLSTATTPTQLAVDVVEQVQDAFHYYHAHIYFLDEATGDLIMAGGTGEAGAALLAQGHKIPKGRGLVGRAAATNEPVLVPDVSQAVGWLPNPLLPDTKSEVAIPISAGKQVMGVLDVQQNVVNGLVEEDVELLQSLAGQVAISLQNARTYEQTKAQADLESMVNDIGQKIQRASTMDDTLQTAIREIGLALGASRVSANIARRQGGSDSGSQN